ncbi:unnamed protein product [Somion occarium]|uniref:PWWP domain-containing protein n=1 Tax=Somion occarium TaxID=3059160 RepID=A0ABP1DCB5_9APHY
MSPSNGSLPEKILPRRAAATKAAMLASEQLLSSPPHSDEDGTAGISGKTSRRSRSRTSKSTNVDLDSKLAVSHERSKCRSDKSELVQKSPNLYLRSLPSFSDSDSDLENLNTLKSPLPEPRASRKRRRSPPIEVTNGVSSNALTGETSPLTSPEQTFKSVLKSANQPAPTSSTSSAKRELSHISISSSDDEDVIITSMIYAVDMLVWVRLNRSGSVCPDETNTMWWPAKVVRSSPLRVLLFGKPPCTHAAHSNIEVDISKSSDHVVLSLTTPSNNLRFHARNYASFVDKSSGLVSPRKRQKVFDAELHAKWEDAFRLMLEVDRVMNNDGFPRMLSYYTTNDARDSSEEVETILDSPIIADDDEDWKPPPCNPMYEIPGELILAKETTKSTQYWPARIIAYVPPTNPSQKQKYRVLYYDGTVKNISPNLFYMETDEGFKDCIMGDDMDNYGLDEVDNRSPSTSPDKDDDPRSPSPTPTTPPPDDFAFIYNIYEQFQYAKPILAAILQERYLPVKPRHEMFMKSEATRRKVCDTGHEKGEFTAAEVEELSAHIRRWIRRRAQRQELGLILPDDPQEFPQAENLSNDVLLSDDTLEMPLSQASGEATDTDAMSEAPLPPSSLLSVVSEKDDTAHAEKTTHDLADETALQEVTHLGQRKSFSTLSEIEQITYCTNILLPEVVLQLLLWRSGLRQIPELLSAEEEERLHHLAEEKARERYWVHDIVLYKRGLNKKMLGHSRSSTFSQPKSRLRSGRL